jgi:hypothetical protein
MNGNEHQRAIGLIAHRDVEGISADDARWLEAHLQSCGECTGFAAALNDTEQALRSFAVMAPVSLVETTRARVHARALELREHQARMVLMGVSFCLGVLTSTLTAWAWWKFGGWVAEKLGLPSGIVEPGVLLFWLLPAVVVAIVMVAIPPSTLEGSLMYRLIRERARGVE